MPKALNYAHQPRKLHLIPFSRVRDLYVKRGGGHWFDADTMRFFKTVLPDVAYEREDGVVYFYTRETNPSGQARFSVRRMGTCGDIGTVGEFHSFTTKAAAQNAAITAAGAP